MVVIGFLVGNTGYKLPKFFKISGFQYDSTRLDNINTCKMTLL